ncbi:chitin synthase (macronuclear) [Tetrahymena thermophila SB210]|uniref:chitin synthase n=1 Tax=Tetrahymena thermophila (strain SB210) TaxID=312017 RepID=I7M8P7_TETTS|nr:chitin synthase [Tetrahymena thermophila SB210]EAR99425.3 chitin synthase [Tetrahymena thermophila SB210]|eukprot:XP_001019670.3 chitin synthase [Tetrahymena thermophila SB210]
MHNNNSFIKDLKFLQPLEVQLQRDEYTSKFNLEARINDINEFREIDILDRDIHKNQHGLISLYNHNSKIKIEPKLMICITMYNESRKELESTLNGIFKNVKTFKEECLVDNLEIVVVIIYDGMNKLCTTTQEELVDIDEDMLEYFIAQDKKIQNDDKEFNMKYQHETYCYNLKLSQIKIDEEEHKNKFEIFDQDKKIKHNYEQWKISNQHYNEKEGKRKFLQDEKDEALKYIQSKKNNGFLYQIQSSLEQIDDTINDFPDKNKKKSKNLNTSKKDKNPDDIDDESISIFHCVKYQNGGKLSSHLWFFSGFCELFQPSYTILLDCGLVPDEKALFNMFLAFETDKNIGGVCGFMGIKFQDVYTDAGQRKDEYKRAQPQIDFLSDLFQKIFDVQKAQMYEYNMGHFIDKPFESLFGYIQVLPGAFSGYRWDALKRDEETKDCILDDYLSSVLDQSRELTLEQQNMNLAEDRILCLKIYSKHGKKYTLKYLPNCRAKVDPVTDLMTLISQRRRWINGSTFALKLCLRDSNLVYDSDHGMYDIIKFKLCMAFAWLNNFLSYISLSVFFIIVFIMIETNVSQVTLEGSILNGSALQLLITTLFFAVYFISVLVIIYISLMLDTRKPEVIRSFYPISTFLGLVMLVAYVFMIIYVILTTLFTWDYYILGNKFSQYAQSGILQSWNENFLKEFFCYLIVVGFFITFIPYIFNPRKILEMIISFIHFIAYQAQYIHLFTIYAYCRIDDFSWGTKGQNTASQQQDVSKSIKFKFVLQWFLTNFFIAFLFSSFLTSTIMPDEMQEYVKPAILTSISVVFVGQLVLRVIGALFYELYFIYFRRKMASKQDAIHHLREQGSEKELLKKINEIKQTIQRSQAQVVEDSILQPIDNQQMTQYDNQQSHLVQQFTQFGQQNTQNGQQNTIYAQ